MEKTAITGYLDVLCKLQKTNIFSLNFQLKYLLLETGFIYCKTQIKE